MSNLFSKLKTDGLEEVQDRLGGGGFIIPTNIYKGKIKNFYGGQAESGALSVTLSVIKEDGKEYKETLYVTNKEGDNFFLNPQDTSKKVPLPGFTIVNDICMIVTGKPLSEQDWESKTANVWDKDAKKELPKSVDQAVDVIDQEIALGIELQLVNVTAKSQSSGKYEPTGEDKQQNAITKVWHPEVRMTLVEAQAGEETEGVFWDKWLKQNEGKEIDRRKVKGGAAGGGTAGAPRSAATSTAAAPKPKSSLFKK